MKACPADALRYGDRDDMLQEARKRIAARPEKYVDHIYGEKEAGGTSVLYLSAVPFAKLGFPDVGNESYPAFSARALHARSAGGHGRRLTARRDLRVPETRARASRSNGRTRGTTAHDHHPEFEPLQQKLWTPFNLVLLALMAFGGLSLIARFASDWAAARNLSDTYAWGLWIVFDLVWIAVAAGAFATAGLIYVFQRKDLYSIGRTAVLMGLLSYSFVTVTLVADLGAALELLPARHCSRPSTRRCSRCPGASGSTSRSC